MSGAHIIFGGMILPVMDIEAALAAHTPTAGLYLVFSVTDTIDGTMTFALGGSGFKDAGTRVSPCVSSWGPARKFMTQSMEARDSDLLVECAASSWVIDTAGTWRDRLYVLLREKQLRGASVTVYQWVSSFGDSGSIPVWHGYWNGYRGFNHRDGALVVTIYLTSRPPNSAIKVSDVVTSDAFPSAPKESIGKIIPKGYGDPRIYTTTLGGASAHFFGFQSESARGVVIDESVDSMITTVRFQKNDGVSPILGGGGSGLSLLPWVESSFWILAPGSYAAGMVDAASITRVEGDNDKVEIDIAMNPAVYIPLQPTDIGVGSGPSGLLNLSALFDSDPYNYVQTTTSDYAVSVNCPSISIDGARIMYVYTAIEVENVHPVDSITLDFGLYNVAESGGENWFNGNKQTQTLLASSGRQTFMGKIFGGREAAYAPEDFANSTWGDTAPDFSSGRFIGRDSLNHTEAPAQILITTSGSARKDYLRIYGMSAVVLLRLPAGSAKRSVSTRYWVPGGQYTIAGWYTKIEEYDQVTGSNKSLQYLLKTQMQKDDTSGTYTGTPSALIHKGCDICAHLLKTSGYQINTSSGTVGNFVDARIEDVANEKRLTAFFGPEPMTTDEVIRTIQSRHPIRLHDEDGIWNCVYEEMNPHSSRFYKSTNDIVRISARKHILSNSVEISELPYDEISNTVSVNYGHGDASGKPIGSFRYQNPLSIELFGSRDELVIDEPWIIPSKTFGPIYSVATEAAKYLARHHGRIRARPRLMVSLKLSQAFWDLKRGHVVEFDDDMESVGLYCPAYRCGLPDYAFARADAPSTNQANDSSPLFIDPASGSTMTVWGMSQQVAGLGFYGITAGDYVSTSSAWKYYDGSAWVDHSSVSASDAGAAVDIFKRTGDIGVSWTRPSPWLWRKAELDFGVGNLKGPCYFAGLSYGTVFTGSSGTAATTFDAIWPGRLFEVVEMTRKAGSVGDYPYVDVVLQEVM